MGVVAACVGDSNTVVGIPTDGGATPDGSTGMMGGGTVDGTPGPGTDASNTMMDGTAPVSCTANSVTCKDAMTLETCNAAGNAVTTKSCVAGCSMSGSAHCETIYPSPPAASADLTAANTMAITFPPGETRINTDTGEMAGAYTRAANGVSANTEVVAGIAFHQNNMGTGIFSFASVTVAKGATVKIFGVNAVALVSAGDFVVSGIIDARPFDSTGTLCPTTPVGGPGGHAGGVSGKLNMGTPVSGGVGGGAGGGAGGMNAIQGNNAGGGGGAYFAQGGAGDQGCHTGTPSTTEGLGGTAFAYSFVGGSGGGGGGNFNGAIGGGGGGAVQIVSGTVITIGEGSAVEGINVGGCGGQGQTGAGGGGSGGTLLLEAPFVQLNAQGVVASNGGGGGGPSMAMTAVGSPGGLTANVSLGVGSFATTVVGGNGGAGMTPIGGQAANTVCGTTEGYGGGGSAGRIHINTRGGMPTVNANAIVSPTVASGATAYGTADVH
jgi:hypothetical protein